MTKIPEKIPSPEQIDKVISEYSIQGESKSTLLALKEFVGQHFSDKHGVLVEMDLQAFRFMQNSVVELNKLKKEIGELTFSSSFTNIRILIEEITVLKQTVEGLSKELKTCKDMHSLKYVWYRIVKRVKKIKL
jgi:hypothetical protein